MRYTYEPRTEIRIKTLELANESETYKMKILQQKRLEEAYKSGVLVTFIFLSVMILGACFSPILNP